MTPILELKNVSAGYDHEVILHQVNLKIYEHDFLGIIGPNGGGKTTLLKVILGLLKPYSGEVIYPVSRQNLFGYLPQNSRFDQRFPIDDVRKGTLQILYPSRKTKSLGFTRSIRYGSI